MLSLHEELREIEGPHSQVLVIRACNTESFVYCDTIDSGVVCSVCSFKGFSSVINLENHSMFWSNKDTFQRFIFLAVWVDCSVRGRTSAPFKVQRSKDSVPCMVIQNNGWATNIVCLFDSPESNVFLTARYKSVVVNRTEFEAQNVEVWCLFSSDLRLFTPWNLWNIPYDDHLFVMSVLSNTC